MLYLVARELLKKSIFVPAKNTVAAGLQQGREPRQPATSTPPHHHPPEPRGAPPLVGRQHVRAAALPRLLV
eukprot:COSAG01_NODE_49984_length_367_cov_1.298507_1_plen_70_part_01